MPDNYIAIKDEEGIIRPMIMLAPERLFEYYKPEFEKYLKKAPKGTKVVEVEFKEVKEIIM